MMNPIAALLIAVLEIYKWVVIAAVIVSWLIAFNVINPHNNFVRTLLRILIALTEPVFRPIRKVIPPMGGLDLSPIIVFVIIWFLQYTIRLGVASATGSEPMTATVIDGKASAAKLREKIAAETARAEIRAWPAAGPGHRAGGQ